MTRIRRTAAAISTVVALGIVGLALQADAGPKTSSKIIPKGATVTMQGSSAFRINGGGLNETGSFSCECTGSHTQGTCLLGRGPTTVICGVGGSTCTGTCQLYTSTSGAMSHGGAIQ